MRGRGSYFAGFSHRLRSLAAVIAVGLLACDEDNGPLDRPTLAALARERGDAFGGAHTGTWLLTLDRTECTCTGEAAVLACLSNPPTTLRLVEGDGVVAVGLAFADVMSGGVEFTGPIDEDGSFSAALVSSIVAVQGQLRLLARIDAVTDLEPAGGGQATMDGRLRVRMAGGVGEIAVDCGSEFEIEGLRLF